LRFEPTVPNILTLLRFIAIPVLARLIFLGDRYNTVAFILFLSIWLTDMLDGYIARHFNQMTEFGKLFDPLVDKLFQFSMGVMMFIVHKLPLWVPIFIFVKELLMIIGSALLLKKKDTVVFAKWYGKLATVLFVIAFAALFFLKSDQVHLANYIFALPAAWSIYAYTRYFLSYLLPILTKKKDLGQA